MLTNAFALAAAAQDQHGGRDAERRTRLRLPIPRSRISVNNVTIGTMDGLDLAFIAGPTEKQEVDKREQSMEQIVVVLWGNKSDLVRFKMSYMKPISDGSKLLRLLFKQLAEFRLGRAAVQKTGNGKTFVPLNFKRLQPFPSVPEFLSCLRPSFWCRIFEFKACVI